MTSSTTGFQVIRSASLVDEAFRQIRVGILNGDLAAGSPLRDSVLAEQMGISRSPVREALRLLEQSGLVEKSANRSYRISDLAAADIPELATLRLADEIVAVRTIVQHKVALDPLDAALERLGSPGTTALEIAAADAAFHAAVVALAGMPRLNARYADLTDQIRLVLLAGDLEQTGSSSVLVERHTALRDALRTAIDSGDPLPAIRAWEAHLLQGMQVPDLLDPL
ncbi:GntR family transcriptional regulator [Herbiconiux daphne]|uniref:GntR family transcriptional regulator n=1 Tax=Herbiconiux daphne TaxID=2970914 RepID=A0ABT2H7W6_9MICO|nr:GntR family transcriptional regulator [Herbiconiux daphne]MCS5736034.1 GntR family transcriptional regulator [Herbiconiux daphne]